MENNTGYFKLNEAEQKLIRPICQSFKINHHNEGTKIKSHEVVANMKKAGYLMTEAQLRKIIGYIRSQNLISPWFILSDGGGYWASDNAKEMKKFYNSMRFRALSILSNIKPIHGMLKMGADQQLTLFADTEELEMA